MLFREVPPKALFLSVYHRHFLECIAPHFSVICFQNQVSCGFYSQDTSLKDALFIPVRMEAVTAIQGCHISTPNLFLLFLKQTEIAVVKTFQETVQDFLPVIFPTVICTSETGFKASLRNSRWFILIPMPITEQYRECPVKSFSISMPHIFLSRQ